MANAAPVRRPNRWDEPFDREMRDDVVAALLRTAPFNRLEESAFPDRLPLRGILKNDARVKSFDPGDLVVREGDYGHSAFIVLDGSVRVALESLPRNTLGAQASQRKSWFGALAQAFTMPRRAEVRGGRSRNQPSIRGTGEQARIFLQDVPGILNEFGTLELGVGEIFGELAALSRSPRSATVFAEDEATLLELRWQGFRDILRYSPALKEHIDQLYRQNALASHLRATPLLADLPAEALQQVVDETLFYSYGDFTWNAEFAKLREQATAEKIAAEPVIAHEDEPPLGLRLIRGGFARVSRRYGDGHQTLTYLGKGDAFGLDELCGRRRSDETVLLQNSLRAIGYVDVIFIPQATFDATVWPYLPAPDHAGNKSRQRRNSPTVDVGMMEFLAESRLFNGTQTMLIDLDRCTRCDDCVRACSDTHGGNPRFLRDGPKQGKYQFAEACMHCVDPVCLIGCPTCAIARHGIGGVVTINEGTCIGCATCANSCPYSAIRMVEIAEPGGALLIDEKNGEPILQATKCDLCSEQPTGPACVNACPHNALARVNWSDVTTATT